MFKTLAFIAVMWPTFAVEAQTTLTFTSGVQKYAALSDATVNLSGRCELWVTNASTPLAGCTINLNSVDAWLFLPGVKPSVVASTYLSQVFVRGVGELLPFKDGSFDAVTISFGLRNMTDRALSLSEMRRVLRPGGSLFVLEFSRPYAWFRPVYFVYLRHILPSIAGWLTANRSAYAYLNRTIEQFPGRAALAGEIRAAGFQDVRATAMSLGAVALHEARAAPA